MAIQYSVRLPGGILLDGVRHRDAVFKQVTGYLEQEIQEIRHNHGNAISLLTRILLVALDKVAGQEPDDELLESLCVIDRQYLMSHLVVLLEGDNVWLHPKCKKCSAVYDVNINQSELPVIYAKDGFPHVMVNIQGSQVRLRIPVGRDQRDLEECNDDEALDKLLRSCVMKVDNLPPTEAFFKGLKNTDIEDIESALESISPALCTELVTVCPECGSQEFIKLNPYQLSDRSDELLFDIHQLASHYHWSEDSILSLSQERRHRYLEFINVDQGIYA